MGRREGRTTGTYSQKKKEYTIEYYREKVKRIEVKFTNDVYDAVVAPACEIADMGMATLMKYAFAKYLMEDDMFEDLVKDPVARSHINAILSSAFEQSRQISFKRRNGITGNLTNQGKQNSQNIADNQDSQNIQDDQIEQ